MTERYYQTTPLFYVNDRPHIGTAYSMIVSDALCRWHRLIGDEVFFLTGTDEHGLKLARSAAEHGTTPQEWVDEASTWFKAAWEALSITNDDFIRTTEPRHYESVAHFVKKIYDNGYIYKGEYAGWYCVSCENYYQEDELREGHICPIHERPVEWLTEENYFFALSRFTEQLRAFHEGGTRTVVPESRRNEALGLIRQGLQDFSISRTSFDWGIPVPWDSDHVFYVWFEALMNYTTAVGYGTDDERFAEWWPAVRHLIGKDIVKFHCVWWPAMCMAAGIAPPRTVLAHGYLLVGGTKMSKSLANQVDPLQIADELGLDALRHYLLRDIVFGLDGEFSYEGVVARYNSDLANNLGNLLQRVTTLIDQKCGGIGAAPLEGSVIRTAFEDPELGLDGIRAAWDAYQPHVALERTWLLIGAANALLETTEPWKMEPGPEVGGILGSALEALRLVAILASPAIPETAAEVWRRIGLDGRPDEPGRAAPGGDLAWGGYPAGRTVVREAPLLPAPSGRGCVSTAEHHLGAQWIDSHCHVHDEDDPEGLIARAAEAGIGALVVVGTGVESSRRAVALAQRTTDDAITGPVVLYATIGLHPHDASAGTDEVVTLVTDASPEPGARRVAGEVVAIGECGLDYHYEYSPRDAQRSAFARQIELALAHDLTLVVHTREAWDDTFSILAETGVPPRTVIHCFTGGPQEARRCLDLGAYLSFSGIATFKNAEDVRAAAALCPADRILVETDAPYLAPVPHRGSPNEPAYVALVGAALADVRGDEVEAFRSATHENTRRAFRLAL